MLACVNMIHVDGCVSCFSTPQFDQRGGVTLQMEVDR
jgi:hypothetical protein